MDLQIAAVFCASVISQIDVYYDYIADFIFPTNEPYADTLSK